MERKDIRGEASQAKVTIYEAIHSHYLQGKKVRVKEHKSGFPTVTADCEDIHILTDIISLEQWWLTKKQEGDQVFNVPEGEK